MTYSHPGTPRSALTGTKKTVGGDPMKTRVGRLQTFQSLSSHRRVKICAFDLACERRPITVLQSLFPLNVVFLDAGAARQSPLVRRLFGDATSLPCDSCASPLGRCYELAVLYELSRICSVVFLAMLRACLAICAHHPMSDAMSLLFCMNELALLFVRSCHDCFVRALSWHLLDCPCAENCERITYAHVHTHTG